MLVIRMVVRQQFQTFCFSAQSVNDIMCGISLAAYYWYLVQTGTVTNLLAENENDSNIDLRLVKPETEYE